MRYSRHPLEIREIYEHVSNQFSMLDFEKIREPGRSVFVTLTLTNIYCYLTRFQVYDMFECGHAAGRGPFGPPLHHGVRTIMVPTDRIYTISKWDL